MKLFWLRSYCDGLGFVWWQFILRQQWDDQREMDRVERYLGSKIGKVCFSLDKDGEKGEV